MTKSTRFSLAVLLLVTSLAYAGGKPSPLLSDGQPVDWWFIFKFNSESFPGCGSSAPRVCLFGGSVQTYKNFGQQFAFASSENGKLKKGDGCVGDTTADPLGATFNEVYNGNLSYVIWNDQFYSDPIANESAPAGHSKGVLAWNNDGDGLVLQVSTPSWPAAGNPGNPRMTDGNTLGCVKDNDVLVSQHFFSLKLTKADVVAVLKGLQNASVVTDPTSPQIVNNGGPPDIQALVEGLGGVSPSKIATLTKLSTGVTLISKPSHLNVPPWQMVSALLGGEPLRAATWYARPEIPTTATSAKPACWDASLGAPGPVQIALSGTWAGNRIGLEGIPEANGNHAKIGVSTGTHTYAIFGDMNQQGSLSGPNCKSSQNGRGGLFYIVDQPQIFQSIRALIKGDTEPAK